MFGVVRAMCVFSSLLPVSLIGSKKKRMSSYNAVTISTYVGCLPLYRSNSLHECRACVRPYTHLTRETLVSCKIRTTWAWVCSAVMELPSNDTVAAYASPKEVPHSPGVLLLAQ